MESQGERALRARVLELEGERAQLEEQVRKLHRAKTTMDLIGGVAHDLAAALTGVVWCSQALCRRVEAHDPELRDGISDFVGAAEFARQLARRLISIGKQPDPQLCACNLSEVVSEATSLLETLRPPTARLHGPAGPCDGWVFGNADQLQQLVINLVANAFDAVAGRPGSVHVELTRIAAPPAVVASRGETTEAGSGGWLCLRVRDDGHGMDEETLRRAFEPFFTTKSAQEGNGLGLVLVHKAVERHGGLLEVQSVPGGGTSIEVLLPELLRES